MLAANTVPVVTFILVFVSSGRIMYEPTCVTETVQITLSTDSLRVDCSLRGFTKVPTRLPERTAILNLSNNNISTLPANVFSPFSNITYLDLSNNQLSILNAKIFSGLFYLEVLNLAGNELCLPNGYPQGVFQDLTSLRILKTFSNRCATRHTNIPDSVLKDLVALEKLSLDVVDNFTFGQGFAHLTKLTHLEASSYHECEKYHVNVTKDSFESLTNAKISHLTLRGCAYREMEKESLRYLPRVNTLNLACARNLNAPSMFQAIHNMKHASLETLVLDGMFIFGKSSLLDMILKAAKTMDKWALGRFLEKLFEKYVFGKIIQPFCDPKLQNLRRLSVRANMIAYRLNFVDDGRACVPHLHHLNLGNNPMFFDDEEYAPKDTSLARNLYKRGLPAKWFWSLTNIRTVDVSHLLSEMYYFDYHYCKNSEADIESFFRKVPKIVEEVPDLPNLNVTSGYIKSPTTKNGTDLKGVESLVCAILMSPGTQVFFADTGADGLTWDLSVIEECPYIVYPLDTLVYLNLSNNDVSFVVCPVMGIKSLKVLDLSFCQMTTFHVDSIKQKYTPIIEIIHIRGNKLNNSYQFPELFSEAVALRELDLSLNGLHSLPDDSFKNLISLEMLDLSSNILSSVNILLSNLTKLTMLDLSFNMISTLRNPFMKQLDLVYTHNPKFILLLYGNPFDCGCDSVQFLDWLKTTNVTIEKLESMKCRNRTDFLIHVNTKQLISDCAAVSFLKYKMIIGTLGSFVFISVLTTIVTYKNRWKIAWYIYAKKRKRYKNKYNILDESDRDKNHDAFVGYHTDHENADEIGLPWVVNELKNYVEVNWGKSLFIFDRDAQCGGSKIGETVSGIQESRKVILVLTETYLKRGNWEMILYWAVEQGLSNTILCCLGGMTIDKLPRTVAKVAMQLQQRYPSNYLEFTAEGNNETMWNGLKMALEEDLEEEE